MLGWVYNGYARVSVPIGKGVGMNPWTYLKRTFGEFRKDNCFRLSAALAYHTVFSLAPTMVIIVAIVGLVYTTDQTKSQGELYSQISSLVGQESADAIFQMMKGAFKPKQSLWATVIGVVMLIVSATAMFVQLQDSLNVVFNVETRASSGVWGFIKDRLLSFALIVGIGFILLVSLVVNAAVTAFFDRITAGLGDGVGVVLYVAELALSLAVITLLFAMIFKVLPDAKLKWRDTWFGAFITAALFTLGRTLIGLYIGNSDLASTYGSAAAIVIILLWVYYSSLVLFFGAEFTQIHASERGGVKATGRKVERGDRTK